MSSSGHLPADNDDNDPPFIVSKDLYCYTDMDNCFYHPYISITLRLIKLITHEYLINGSTVILRLTYIKTPIQPR